MNVVERQHWNLYIPDENLTQLSKNYIELDEFEFYS